MRKHYLTKYKGKYKLKFEKDEGLAEWVILCKRGNIHLYDLNPVISLVFFSNINLNRNAITKFLNRIRAFITGVNELKWAVREHQVCDDSFGFIFDERFLLKYPEEMKHLFQIRYKAQLSEERKEELRENLKEIRLRRVRK